MSEPRPDPADNVDRLVRAYLERRAEGVDARRVLARLKGGTGDATSGAGAPARRSVFWRRSWPWAVSAAILLAFFGGLYLGPRPARASAEALVRQARAAHALPLDRCYLVQTRAERAVFDHNLMFLVPPQTRLWTRGDRFWIESALPGHTWAWGRDDRGRLWFARSPKEGVRFEADEADEADLPPQLAVTCDVNSMRLETLLDEVLADFDLERADAPAGEPRVVRARPKPGRGHPTLREAVLEIDAESNVLRRVVLSRALRGRPLARVTFTLIDAAPQPDASYQLEGHLDADASVFTREFRPLRRRPLLAALFAGLAGQKSPEGNR